ncbi:MAG: hypothetical protein QM811_20810 [Pirellulales bacterium]
MPMRTALFCVVVGSLICVGWNQAQEPTAAPALSAADAKAALEKAGLKVSTTGVLMPEEAEFSKSMRDLDAVRKSFVSAEKEHAAVEGEADKIQKTVTQIKTQLVQMNAAIAGNLPVNEHNRLVGMINASRVQTELLLEQLEKTNDKAKASRAKAAEAREGYITKILAARGAAEKVENNWGKLATDAQATAALAKVAEVLKKPISAKPSQTFTLAEKQLQLLEQKILSESIKLTEDSGTFMVSVLIDGKHTKQMVVDSGATSISLPFALAKELGMEPTTPIARSASDWPTAAKSPAS